MASRSTKPSKGLARRTTVLAPLSSEERAIIGKVNACQILRVPVGRVRPSPHHARIHSPEKLTALAASIRRYGTIEPIIVDQDYTIISGMARWMVCRELGIAEVPVIFIEHLSPIEFRTLRIAMGRFPGSLGVPIRDYSPDLRNELWRASPHMSQ